MKYERRNLIFLKFCDSNFSFSELCSKPAGEIVNLATDLQLLALENTDHSKPTNSLVINNDPSRL